MEVGILAVTRYAGLAVPEGRLGLGVVGQRHGYLWLSPHVIWMAPVAYTAVLGLAAGALAGLGRAAPGALTPVRARGVLIFLALTSLIWTYPRLHWAAGAVLAAGLAVQGSRWTVRHPGGTGTAVRRVGRWAGGATALVAVAMLAWFPLSERWTNGRAPQPAAGAPNVVVVILDTVRAASLSLYAYSRSTTPNLEARARAGVVFERAYSTSPWTLPAHVSLFTGRWPYEFTANWFVPFQGEFPTLAQYLGSHGYETAGFVANGVYTAWESGLNRGFARYEDYPLTAGELVLATGAGRKLAHAVWVRRVFGAYDVLDRKDAARVTSDFLDWQARSRDRPFFAFLNYLDAHEPYMPPPALAERFGPQDARQPELNTYQIRRAIRLGRADLSAEELQADVDAYDATLAYLDQELERLFATLESRGVLSNTLVVVSSDHGEQFGEHGRHLHGNSLYDPVLRVPLAFWFGDRLPGARRVAAPVSLRSVAATVAHLATGSTGPFPGTPLSNYWEAPEGTEPGLIPPEQRAPEGPAVDPAGLRNALASEFNDIRGAPIVKGVVAGRYRYIWSETGRQELYDLLEDPGELRNLVGDAAYQETVLRMRNLMAPHVRNDVVLWERLPQN